jgi:hypothetical protein
MHGLKKDQLNFDREYRSRCRYGRRKEGRHAGMEDIY